MSVSPINLTLEKDDINGLEYTYTAEGFLESNSINWQLENANFMGINGIHQSETNNWKMTFSLSNPDNFTPGFYKIKATDLVTEAHTYTNLTLVDIYHIPIPIAKGETICGKMDNTGEKDWYKFEANAGDIVTIETFAPSDNSQSVEDTKLYLYADDQATLLSFNDNNEENLYSLIQDYEITETGTYYIKVMQNDENTGFYNINLREFVSTSPRVDNIKFNFNLQNKPNPFNNSTEISFDKPEKETVALEIFDITGKKVKTFKTNSNKVIWNGKNENKQNLANGIYFYKVSAKNQSQMKKLILMK